MNKLLPLAAVVLLSGCAHKLGEFNEAGGINATRSTCPAVAIPAATGDITLFDPPASRDARAIDVTAYMTNVRVSCAPQGDQVVAQADFDVIGHRRDTSQARDVTLPYFSTVVQGGNTVIAKRISRVALHFDAGQADARTRGSGGAVVSLAAATLPEAVVTKINRKRKADDADASIDPMAAPDVKAALARASFELLVGFQLTQEQLRYNATR
ncbi:Lipoprotein [Sphingomonas antarctica]|uniref:hypothetical protein n=1 Tax=Sphingomonas antarctica TaxID=2040274 RepID=UPI0039E94950